MMTGLPRPRRARHLRKSHECRSLADAAGTFLAISKPIAILHMERSLYGTAMPGAGSVHHIRSAQDRSDQPISSRLARSDPAEFRQVLPSRPGSMVSRLDPGHAAEYCPLAFDIGPSSSVGSARPRAANRSDQETATVDHQSLAGHECLSHQVEIALGNLLRVGDMPHR